ncbi:MAG TPA: hypothetical protein VLF39_04580 [Candidatus Saccharimonadales bacterium]|nr:hypothetical protein [Candidatus Saccharimonadales bacterium]
MKRTKLIYILALVISSVVLIGSLASWFLYGLAQGLQEVPNPSAVNGAKVSLIIAIISTAFILIFVALLVKYSRATKKIK